MALLRNFKSIMATLALGAMLAGVPGLFAQDAAAKAKDLAAVAKANNQFALDFYQKINASEKGENIFVSPFSISTALAMTFEGSRNNTRTQMANVLHLKMTDAERKQGFAALLAGTKAGPEKHYKLDVANALWGDKRLQLKPEFVHTIDKFYGGGLNTVDFAHDPGGSVKTINTWVEDKTAGKIKDLVHSDNIDATTELILTNAIYFKGDWVSPFNEKATKDEDFHLAGGKTVKTPMMWQKAHFNYVHDDGMAAIEMPYADKDLSMIAILPDGDAEAMGAKLTVEEIEKLRGEMESSLVDVTLPKFKFETRYLLEDMLEKMGMPDAFSEAAADFAGMTGGKDLYIAHVIHQAFIDVNEKGSEAAAATAVVMDGKSVHFDVTERFRADKPFVFLIVHKATGSILFIGRVSSPSGVAAKAGGE